MAVATISYGQTTRTSRQSQVSRQRVGGESKHSNNNTPTYLKVKNTAKQSRKHSWRSEATSRIAGLTNADSMMDCCAVGDDDDDALGSGEEIYYREDLEAVCDFQAKRRTFFRPSTSGKLVSIPGLDNVCQY